MGCSLRLNVSENSLALTKYALTFKVFWRRLLEFHHRIRQPIPDPATKKSTFDAETKSQVHSQTSLEFTI